MASVSPFETASSGRCEARAAMVRSGGFSGAYAGEKLLSCKRASRVE